MKWINWLEKWQMSSLKINTGFLEMDFAPEESDRDAAWELYIELLTRITTQPLADKDGDEKTAVLSVFSLFALTREIIKSHGRSCIEFTKIAVVVLNQVVRPFTAKWHKPSIEGCFDKREVCSEFRTELTQLQKVLRTYTKMLSDMAGVEDLTELEV